MSNAAQRIADLSPGERRALLAQLLRKKASETQPFQPLSYNQQGIWFLYQLAPESMVYNVNFAARILSDVDIGALRRGFQSLVDRHPILRTTFALRDGKPAQQVHQKLAVHFVETDASALDSEVLKTRLHEEAYRPFDLERGPSMRVNLFTRSAREHVLLLVVHHIVIDFWSLAVLLTELGTLYSADKAGVQALLPALDTQYSDYVRWQSEMLAGPEGERLWNYWRKQLVGQLPLLDFPTDRPRPPVPAYQGASHNFHLNDGLSRRLKALAKAQGATLYMVLLAAFQVILHYHTGQQDLLVGSPMLGRSRAEFEGIVGLFTNPVILRADCSGNPAFEEFLGQVRRTVLAALEYQDYPTLLLVERLRPARDLSRPPLCQVMFVLDKPHQLAEQGASALVLGDSGLSMNLGGIELEALALEHRAATLDLVMLTIETAHSLSVSIRYNSELFDAATVARVAKHFEALLNHVTTQADARFDTLKEMLAEIDRHEDATIRQQYREANLQKLKMARRVPVNIFRPANGREMPRQSDIRPHLDLNGTSPGSKQP
jgi:hypothetical protein